MIGRANSRVLLETPNFGPNNGLINEASSVAILERG